MAGLLPVLQTENKFYKKTLLWLLIGGRISGNGALFSSFVPVTMLA